MVCCLFSGVIMNSKHYSQYRNERQYIIDNFIKGDGNVVDSFVIDRGHKDGAEIHTITDTGLIIVYNKDSGVLVTKLIARPSQIKRYYKNSNKSPPGFLLGLAKEHKEMGWNDK